MAKVIKRYGDLVEFNERKIYNAILAAMEESKEGKVEQVKEVTDNTVDFLFSSPLFKNKLDPNGVRMFDVEQIQDVVENELMKIHLYETARCYIKYRQKHAQRRRAQKNLIHAYKYMFFTDSSEVDLKRDNANINTDAPMGIMLKMGAESSKYFTDQFVLSDEFFKADKENWIHIHDKDFSLITLNCCQIDLLKLLHGGFSTGHGFLREPNSIRAYAALACIAIQSNQNDMFGGQSINAFDYAMAEGVRKSYKKLLVNNIEKYLQFKLASDSSAKDLLLEFKLGAFEILKKDKKIRYKGDRDYIIEFWNTWLPIYINKSDMDCIIDMTEKDVEEETHQAMEALIHNFNTLHSRAGAQVPFSSINFGMDTSLEGQLVIDEVLNAIDAGLGNGETPIFPISVFQLKKGVNYDPEDPNYYLFKKACKVSAKRLFPNFLSLDASYNIPYYREDRYNSYVATMGCRTRVMSNVNGPEESGGRGNFSFVTINLPKLALASKGNIDKFWKLYDKYIQICHDYLLARLEIIAEKHVYNFPFLMGQKVWMDSENLLPTDSIRDVLKHASYSIGFCGLAECLVALMGKHHGESEEAQEMGLKIIQHLRDKTDAYTREEHMNWSTFATPAESTAGQFQRANRDEFGIIPGVTDRDYMTNSSHVPVYYNIKAIDKIRIEAPYHKICNAGHIAYIEIDGDPTKNLEAFETLVRAMHDADMGYFSINHPVDRDPVCGYTGIIGDECPHCHRNENNGKGHLVISRIK